MTFLKKNFQVRERILLSALAPPRRAAAASEPKAPPCPLTVRAHHGARPCWRKSTCRSLRRRCGRRRKRRPRLRPRGLCRSPYRLPRRPNPTFHRALAICPPQLAHSSDSEQFRPTPRTCHGVGGRLRMRRTDCEGGSPRVRYTTARFHHATRGRGGVVAARGARTAGRDAGDRVYERALAGGFRGRARSIPPRPEGGRLHRG